MKTRLEYIQIKSDCACRCGQEAKLVYKGIPVATPNPTEHYRKFMEQTDKLVNSLSVQGATR